MEFYSLNSKARNYCFHDADSIYVEQEFLFWSLLIYHESTEILSTELFTRKKFKASRENSIHPWYEFQATSSASHAGQFNLASSTEA